MKMVEIIGANYFGNWTEQRTACRAIVIRDGHILLSYETVTDQWMVPGGGLEPGEDEAACCVREVAEETGYMIKPSPCMLELDEYYEDCRYVDRYFFGTATGRCERHLTDRERVEAMIEVKVTPQRDMGFDAIARRIYCFDEVKSVFLMSGSYDLLVLVEARTLKELAAFVSGKLSPLETVTGTATSFVLKRYKEEGVIFDSGDSDRRLVISP